MRWLTHALIGAAVIVAAAVTSSSVFGATGKSAPHHGLAVAKDNKNKVKGKVKQGTLTVTGTNDDESIVLRLRAGDPSTLDLMVDGSSIDDFKRSEFNQIEVGAGGGGDVVAIDESNGSFTDTEATTLDGEGGNDRLVGGSFSETLIGGDGNDTIDGNRGSDVAFLGAGDDSFVWDPGDGSDTVEGQAGSDTMVFNGSNASERIDLSANGQRLRLTRDVGTITMDTAGVETVEVNALGSTDTVTINDLTGTDVQNVKTDLSSNGAGDGQPDQVILNGTAGNDAITVTGSAGAATVTGLAATVQIAGAEPAADTLAIDALVGDDAVDASGLAADAIKLSVVGSDGDDVLIGGAGDDVISGGEGDDFLKGGPGVDTLDGGPGNNIVIQG